MALRFVLANPNVTVALSGMQNLDMVEENAKVAGIEGPLTAEELARVAAMLEENKRLAELYCTGCKYCMPCPKGINIPRVFELMNYHKVYGLTDYAKNDYARLMVPLSERADDWYRNQGVDASQCVKCGQCEKKCPQHLKIIEQLAETHATLG
jgi:predicted aldo/keto reductase-like oxidoreductase